MVLQDILTVARCASTVEKAGENLSSTIMQIIWTWSTGSVIPATMSGKVKQHWNPIPENTKNTSTNVINVFSPPLLTQHTKYRHDKNEVSCNICMASCRNEMAPLRHHMKAHLGYKKKYRCSKCDLRVISKQHLKTHIRSVHEKLKDYKCSHCNFATTQPQHLQLHIKSVHLKIKDQKCPYCDFTSTQRSHVKTHIQLLHEVFILEKRITYVLNAVMQHIK